MEMELVVEADDAARLTRLKDFVRHRTASSRPRALRALWHDSPDRALARSDLILEEAREGWLLEQLHPGHTAWPPTSCPPVIEQAEQRAALAHPLPELLTPVASCTAREVRHDLSIEGDPVTVTLRRGTLRSVAAERAFGRMTVSGADHAVRSIALGLADSLQVHVPRASLAAEAVALADGHPPPPRRLGPPVLPVTLRDGSVAACFRYALGHLTDVILHYGPVAAGDQHGPEAVHQMRVAVRRARSILSVFHGALGGPAFDSAGQYLKGLGGKLGPTRDWDVFVTETAPAVGSAMPSSQHLTRLLAAARRQRQDSHAALRDYLQSPAFRRLGIELAWLAAAADGCEILETGQAPLPAFAASVIQRRWKKLTTAGRAIEELDAAGLHNVRLRAKRARYAAEIFAPLFPGKPTQRFLRRLSRLQEALGILNDASVAHALMDVLGGAAGRHGYAVGLVTGFTAARAVSVRPDALAAWKKLRHATPFWVG